MLSFDPFHRISGSRSPSLLPVDRFPSARLRPTCCAAVCGVLLCASDQHHPPGRPGPNENARTGQAASAVCADGRTDQRFTASLSVRPQQHCFETAAPFTSTIAAEKITRYVSISLGLNPSPQFSKPSKFLCAPY